MLLSLAIKDILIKTLNSIIILVIGIIIGIGIVMLVYLIITLIHQRIRKQPRVAPKIISPITDPNKIILKYQVLYENEYSHKGLSLRINSLKKIAFDLVRDIATIYHPNAEQPILEVSLESILLLTNHIIDQIDHVIDEIISSSVFKVVWIGYASFHNVKNFFKGIFKKEKNENVSLDIRKLKLSFVLSELEGKTINSNPNNQIEDKKYFLLDTFINNQIKELIKTIANEAILIYSNKVNNNDMIGDNKND